MKSLNQSSNSKKESQPIKPTYAVGVSVLLTNEKGQVLLGKRKNTHGEGLWSTPGGRIEQDETLFEAAAREFREECCATLGTVEILGFKEHFRYGMHYFMVYVHAGYYIGKIKNGIPKKSGPWQWRDIKKVCNTSLLTKCTEPFDMLQKALMLSSTKARAIC